MHTGLLSFIQLFVTPWTVAHQAPLSMEFSIREWTAISYAKLIVSPFICMYYIFINNGINSLLLILGMI